MGGQLTCQPSSTSPDQHQIDNGNQYGCTAYVLGALGKSVVVQRSMVDSSFYGRVYQLDYEQQQHAAHHQGAPYA